MGERMGKPREHPSYCGIVGLPGKRGCRRVIMGWGITLRLRAGKRYDKTQRFRYGGKNSKADAKIGKIENGL